MFLSTRLTSSSCLPKFDYRASCSLALTDRILVPHRYEYGTSAVP